MIVTNDRRDGNSPSRAHRFDPSTQEMNTEQISLSERIFQFGANQIHVKCVELIANKGETMDWLKDKPDTYKFHFAHPEISVPQYLRHKRLELGRKIASQHRIYLDTKQWLELRDVFLGRPRNEHHALIYDHLMKLKSAGKVICPISYSVYAEVMMQTSDDTRNASAELVDLLADGCCCIPMHELTERELMYFMIEKATGNAFPQPPILHTVWTKCAYILGNVVPHSDALPPEVNIAMQKSMYDLLFEVKFAEMVKQLGSRAAHRGRDDGFLVASLMKGKLENLTTHKSFHELFCAEVRGGLDAIEDILTQVMHQMAELTGHTDPISNVEKKASAMALANLVAGAFQLKKVKTELSQIHIHAALHACLRWDKNRKYEANDFEDIRHACVALPYYDTFCTERSLRHQITQGHMQLDKDYNTLVISTDTEFLEHVKALTLAL